MPIIHKDLEGVVLPHITIDEFEPKSGENREVIVVAFYTSDSEPATDLNTFIQRSFIEILDSDVSPNVDEEGRYIVFVELERNDQFFNNFFNLVKDIENTTGKIDWEVKPYLADDPVPIDDKKLPGFVITEPNDYKEKEDYVAVKSTESIEQDLNHFLKESQLHEYSLTDNNSHVTFNNKVVAKVIAFGETENVLHEQQLHNKALTIFDVPDEIITLRYMLGENWEVEKIENYVVLNNDTDNTLIIKYPEYIY